MKKTKKTAKRRVPKKQKPTETSLKKLRAEASKKSCEYLTERQIIRMDDPYYPILEFYCHKANALYNQGMYQFRQAYYKGRWKGYVKIERVIKRMRNARQSMIYEIMGNIHLGQQVLRQAANDCTNWNKAMKAWDKDPSGFSGRPKMPKYKEKGGVSMFKVDTQTFKLKGAYIEIPALDGIVIPLGHETDKVQEIRVIPRNGHIVLEIVYRAARTAEILPDNGKYMSIDPGVNNVFTCVSNVEDFQPYIINGKKLKSINRWYNKERARLRSEGDRCGQSHHTRRLDGLYFWRNEKVKRFAHEASKCIVNSALSHGIPTIVIGSNQGWKQEFDARKKDRQNLIGIPHETMISMIEYKANLAGIAVIRTEESYTSQTSFLDCEEPVAENGNKARKEKGLSPANRRKSRGLFVCDKKRSINADVNGAYQILKKVVPNTIAFPGGKAAVDRIAGIRSCPVKVSLCF